MLPWLQIFLKGMLMGVADIVPGVSGGTIAFITGIYQRLIDAIASALPAIMNFARDRQFSRLSSELDLPFLLTLFAGILTSVALFASLIHSALQDYPIALWSFFLGLIVASVFVVRAEMNDFSWREFLALIVGALLAWWLTASELPLIEPTLTGAFVSGFIAICAMILPGVSGSFLLLLLGTYGFVLGAVKQMELSVLMIFAAGCLCGLLLMARVLRYCLKHFHDLTVAVLLGLMIGALNKVWPWKLTISYRENSLGEQVPFLQENVLPVQYESALGLDPSVGYAVICFLVGIACVAGVSALAKLKSA